MPNEPTYKLVPSYNEDGALIFIELDEFDVALGEWSFGDEEWMFDEYPPLGDVTVSGLPQTGIPSLLKYQFVLLGLSLIGLGFSLTKLIREKKKGGNQK